MTSARNRNRRRPQNRPTPEPSGNPPVNLRKYLVLAGVTAFAASGDSLLSYGMKQLGPVSWQGADEMLLSFLNPWVGAGILLLLAFFACYMTALSWADLTYVLPATSLGYVLIALIAKFALHEQISAARWLGILLISGGVGFVAGGPAKTDSRVAAPEARSHPRPAAAGRMTSEAEP